VERLGLLSTSSQIGGHDPCLVRALTISESGVPIIGQCFFGEEGETGLVLGLKALMSHEVPLREGEDLDYIRLGRRCYDRLDAFGIHNDSCLADTLYSSDKVSKARRSFELEFVC
jgi:hypothetical protein